MVNCAMYGNVYFGLVKTLNITKRCYTASAMETDCG